MIEKQKQTVTPVFRDYWHFASERHRIFEKRLRGEPPPWTADPILSRYRFTNSFRVLDRVSQYLLREVIYHRDASQDPRDVVARILAFKLFNAEATWVALTSRFGIPTASDFQVHREELAKHVLTTVPKPFSPAYRPPSSMARRYGYKGEGAATRGVFSFLSDLVGSDFVARLQPCSSYEDAFRLFSSLPGTWRRRILGDAAVD